MANAPDNNWPDEPARSMLRVPGAGLAKVVAPIPKQNIIDPGFENPQREGLRYRLTESMLGKLEALARARYTIRKLVPIDRAFVEGTLTPNWEIAQSVNASCEIEGEGVSAENLTLALNAATQSGEGYADKELQERMAAIRSIYETYVWALTTDRETFVSFDFILELHKRMLQSTRADIAGALKKNLVVINHAGYAIVTLPPIKAEAFLLALCNRTNLAYERAVQNAEASLFLITAEFIVDFLAIHPFSDGNGRLARLLSTYLLERCGYHFARFYPLDQIVVEKRPEYYKALFSAQFHWYSLEEDLTPWVRFYVDAVYVQSERALQRIRDQNTREREDGEKGGLG